MGRSGGYGGGQGAGGKGGNTHPSQMSVQEKVASTCKDWNAAGDANGRRPPAFVSIMERNLSMVVPRSTEAVYAGILATRNQSICKSLDCSRMVVDIDILLQ